MSYGTRNIIIIDRKAQFLTKFPTFSVLITRYEKAIDTFIYWRYYNACKCTNHSVSQWLEIKPSRQLFCTWRPSIKHRSEQHRKIHGRYQQRTRLPKHRTDRYQIRKNN